jgi:hypothetical protein
LRPGDSAPHPRSEAKGIGSGTAQETIQALKTTAVSLFGGVGPWGNGDLEWKSRSTWGERKLAKNTLE